MNRLAHTNNTEELKEEIILIGPSSFAALDSTPMDLLKSTGAKVIDNPYKRRLTKDELMALLSEGITGLIAGLEPLDRDVMEQSQLQVISRCGSGMTNVDQAAAAELDIAVCSTPDAPVSSVAELTIAAMLNLLRLIAQMNTDLHSGRWNKQIGRSLSGKTVVIIGFGRIGQKVASLLDAFGAQWIAVDPAYDGQGNIPTMSLEEALKQADIITIHSSGNECVLNKSEMKFIKPGALLLNGSRGELVDELSLIKALDDQRIAGAWMDVFIDEPYNGPLTQYKQVLLTPHVGSYTSECRLNMETQSVENLITAFNTRKPAGNV